MRLEIATLSGQALLIAAAHLAGEDVCLDDDGHACFADEHSNAGASIDADDPQQFGYLLKKAKCISTGSDGEVSWARVDSLNLEFRSGDLGTSIFRAYVANAVGGPVLDTNIGKASEIDDLLEELQDIEPGINVPIAERATPGAR